MKQNSLIALLGANTKHLNLATFNQIYKLVGQMDPEFVCCDPILTLHACATALSEAQSKRSQESNSSKTQNLYTQNILMKLSQSQKEKFIKILKNISYCSLQWNQTLTTKLSILEDAYKNYRKFMKICTDLGQKLQIPPKSNRVLASLFWVLHVWAKNKDIKSMAFDNSLKIMLMSLKILYTKYAKRISEDLIIRIFDLSLKQCFQQNQNTVKQNQLKYQLNFSNKSNDLQQAPKANRHNRYIAQDEELNNLQNSFETIVQFCLEEISQEQKLIDLPTLIHNVIENKQISEQMLLLLIEKLATRTKSLIQTKKKGYVDETCFIEIFKNQEDEQFLQKSKNQEQEIVQQALSQNLKKINLFIQKYTDIDDKTKLNPSFSKLSQQKFNQSYFEDNRSNHETSSSPGNQRPRYVTPSHLFQKLQINKAHSNKYTVFFRNLTIIQNPFLSKQANYPKSNKNTKKISEIRLQLLEWIRKCIESVKQNQLANIKQLFEHANQNIEYRFFMDSLNVKYSKIIDNFAGRCLNYSNRKTQMYKFFTYLFLLTIKQFKKYQDLILLAKSQKSFCAYLTLSANIFNFCYNPPFTSSNNISEDEFILSNYDPKYSEYCKIFQIDLLQAFKPINWVGRHIQLPGIVNDYLFYLEGTIVLRDIINQSNLLSKLSQVSDHSKTTERASQQKFEKLLYIKLLKRLKQHFILQFYSVCKHLFSSEKDIRVFYPLLNFVLDKMLGILAKIGYQPVIYLILLMGLALQEQQNCEYIEKVFFMYYSWRNITNKQLFYDKQIMQNLTQFQYKHPISLLIYYNEVFVRAAHIILKQLNQKELLQNQITFSPAPLKKYTYCYPQKNILQKRNLFKKQWKYPQTQQKTISPAIKNQKKVHILAQRPRTSHSQNYKINDIEQGEPRKLVKKQ